MSFTWSPHETPPEFQITLTGWCLVILRGVPILLVLATGVVLMAALRLIERPLHGLSRPRTPWTTDSVWRVCLRSSGI